MRPNDDTITEMHIFLAVEGNERKENRACISKMTKACRSTARGSDRSKAADAFPERANYIAGTS